MLSADVVDARLVGEDETALAKAFRLRACGYSVNLVSHRERMEGFLVFD